MKSLFYFLILFIGYFSIEAQSTPTHSIRGMYGDRAAGMGGAFAAVSDDPSGAFYNPAGLGFISNTSVTTSVISYNDDRQSYNNFPSYGLSLQGKSMGITSGFIGSVRSFGNFKVGFTIASPTNYNVDQYSNSFNSLGNTTNSVKLRLSESLSTTYVGPSFAYMINEKISIGTTFFGFFERYRSSQEILVTASDNTYVNPSTESLRDSRGFLPIIGIQFMPTSKFSLGLSIRKPFTTSGYERDFTRLTANNTNASNINFEDSSSSRYGAVIGNPSSLGVPNNQTLFLGGNSQVNGRVPEPKEIRFGFAWFASKRFLLSADVIYTSGYHFNKYLYNYEPTKRIFALTDNRIRALDLEPVTNFAAGLEYYLFEFLAIRLGYYTNYANAKNISWFESALKTSISSAAQFVTQNNGNTIVVALNDFRPSIDRNEFVNLRGITLGFSYETSKAIFSITYINESGRGNAQPVETILPAAYRVYNDRVYIGATIKQD
ncbi:MAG TPA: hypothetical protein PK079_04785 [Leptospiraceae bacterium]|nr:hypothetical protein [Leptospiraceae bacterium]HMW04974.1 hypothetical protein [Leptospiraceae bacterium]HMY30805.1 hypothetical protein [Leptospiraceae bacterium]HMZ64266.1 hypothetical protein [Leptospiraceae bacterium]HNB99472.1 hypothetical protein [Leptospiraceae bacterium]